MDSDKQYNIRQMKDFNWFFIVSACTEESDSEGDMDMTQEGDMDMTLSFISKYLECLRKKVMVATLASSHQKSP